VGSSAGDGSTDTALHMKACCNFAVWQARARFPVIPKWPLRPPAAGQWRRLCCWRGTEPDQSVALRLGPSTGKHRRQPLRRQSCGDPTPSSQAATQGEKKQASLTETGTLFVGRSSLAGRCGDGRFPTNFRSLARCALVLRTGHDVNAVPPSERRQQWGGQRSGSF
jgi:hypothetical protein